jgi:hypothetical protein
MLKLFMGNPREFIRLIQSGIFNRLTKFFNNLAGRTSARAYRLLYGGEMPAALPNVATLRDDEVFVVVTIYKGSVRIDGIVGAPENVQMYLDNYPGAVAYVRRIDELKQSVMGIITSPQIYASGRSDKKWLL